MTSKSTWVKALMLSAVLSGAALSGVAQGGELGDLFADYQGALESGKKAQIVETAKAVYVYASKNLPQDSKNRAAASLNYGSALIKAKDYGKAENVLAETLDMYRNIHGESGEALIDPLMMLARARAANVQHASRHRYRQYIDDALEIVEAGRGKDSFLYAYLLQEAGTIGLDLATDRFSLNYLEQAYGAFSGPLSDHQLERFLAGFYLGKYFISRKKYRQAETYLEEALQLADAGSEKDTQLELTARAFLVEVYDHLQEREKSIAQCRAIGEATPFNMDQEPQPIFSRSPEYPRVALSAGREGYAIVEFTISDEGFVEDVETLETKGSLSFGRATEEYLQNLRFAPRFVDGSAVDTPGRKMKVSYNLAK